MADAQTPEVKSAPFDVFLSHNGKDKAAVTRIAEKLRHNGLRPWLDIWELTPGGRWQDELHDGLQASRGCAYFIGPYGEGDWAREELEAARSRAAKDRSFRLFPVLLPGVPDPFDRTTLPPFLGGRTWVDYRAGLDDGDAFQALINATRGLAPGKRVLPDDPGAVCPYRGLMAFDEKDAPFFFGRDGDVQQLVEKLKSSRFLAVMGPSGSGKSSLVRAGLIPALRRGALPGSEQWPIHVIKPGARPLEALAAALVAAAPAPSAGMQATLDGLASDPRTLHLASTLAGGTAGGTANGTATDPRTVWVIDQAEEMFSLCHDDRERAAFIANLHYAASVPGGRCVVVLAMRADFYARCAAYPDLAALISTSQFLVGPLSTDGLREAIEQPAHAVNLELEEGLVGTILDDIERQPGALPLLEHALLELWDRRRGSMLTLEGYREAGGVQGAIAKRAESVYSSFSPTEQQIARRALLRLTQPGEGTEDTRRRAAFSELVTRPAEEPQVQAVVDELTDARLLTASADPQTGDSWVDISHEALIRGWPRVQQWLDDDRSSLLIHRRITESAQEWERLGRNASELYRGARLAEAREWRTTNEELLNDEERAFLDASAALDVQERAAAERRRRRFTLVAAGLAAVFLVLAGLATFEWLDALQGRNTLASQASDLSNTLAQRDTALTAAQQQQALAESRLLAAKALASEDHIDLALLLSAEANLRSDAVDVGRSLLRELTVEPDLLALTANANGSIDGVAISADGKQFAWASSQGDVVLAAVADPAKPTLTLHQTVAGHTKVAFNQDANRLVMSGGAGIQMVELPSGTILWSNDTADVTDIAIGSGAGHVAALLRDGSVRLFDAATGADAGTPIGARPVGGPEPGLAIVIARLSSDGRLFARAETDETVSIWDVEQGKVLRNQLAPGGTARDMAFSPDGQDLAVLHLFGIARYGVQDASRDGTDRVDVTDGQWIQWVGSDPSLPPSSASGNHPGNSAGSGVGPPDHGTPDASAPPLPGQPPGTPGGSSRGLVLSSTADGLRWLHDATAADAAWQSLSRRPLGNQVVASADGGVVVQGFGDGRVALFQMFGHSPLAQPLAGELPMLVPGQASPFGTAALAIDPRYGAIFDSFSGAIVVHRPDAPDVTIPVTGSVQGLALNADGSRVASVEVGAGEGAVSALVIRSVPDAHELLRQTLGDIGGANFQVGLAYAAGGGTLAIGLPTGQVLGLDATTGVRGFTFQDPGVARVTAISFSTGNRLFAGVVAPPNGTRGAAVVEINPTSGALVSGPWSVAGEAINSLVVDPSGRLLIAAVANGGLPPGGELTVIDLTNPGQPIGSLGPPSDAYAAIGFEAGGRSLVSVGVVSGWLRWDASVPSWTALACRIAGRDLTPAEWSRYVGPEPFRSVCPGTP